MQFPLPNGNVESSVAAGKKPESHQSRVVLAGKHRQNHVAVRLDEDVNLLARPDGQIVPLIFEGLVAIQIPLELRNAGTYTSEDRLGTYDSRERRCSERD